jgi:hypothetical protein
MHIDSPGKLHNPQQLQQGNSHLLRNIKIQAIRSLILVKRAPEVNHSMYPTMVVKAINTLVTAPAMLAKFPNLQPHDPRKLFKFHK